MHLSPNSIPSSSGSPIYYTGTSLEEGALPAVIYFALTGESSLFQDPFNQPVKKLNDAGIRVFSWDLPFHSAALSPQESIERWITEFSHSSTFLTDFIEFSQINVTQLESLGLIKKNCLGVMGLSRGAFIATHLAAKEPRIKAVTGFSPLTEPHPSVSLSNLCSSLVHTPLSFYIGNNDTRVGTDLCYKFCRQLTNEALIHGVRSPAVELTLYPSIGHRGHGTPLSIFHQGADWLKQRLLS